MFSWALTLFLQQKQTQSPAVAFGSASGLVRSIFPNTEKFEQGTQEQNELVTRAEAAVHQIPFVLICCKTFQMQTCISRKKMLNE